MGTDPFLQYSEFHDWLRFYAEHRTDSRKSVKTAKEGLKDFGFYLMTEEKLEHLKSCTKQHILRWKAFREKGGYAFNTIRQRMSFVRQLFQWMVNQEHILDSPFPEMTMIRGVQPATPVILSPKQIFEMRQRRMVKVEKCAAIEMLLSSGMRIAELRQLRANQLEFDQIPIDVTTGKPSLYVGGRIQIRKERTVVKRRRSRVVYFSRLAAKLILKHMEKHGIDPNSPTPLFPWSKTIVNKWFHSLVKDISGFIRVDESSVPTGNFTDINLSEVALPERFKKLIAARQRDEARIKQEIPDPLSNPNKPTPPKDRIKLHGLRYSFACFMYYRNYFGEYQATDRLRTILGHGFFNTTYTYLTQMSLVTDDTTWCRLWLGRPTDWLHTQ